MKFDRFMIEARRGHATAVVILSQRDFESIMFEAERRDEIIRKLDEIIRAQESTEKRYLTREDAERRSPSVSPTRDVIDAFGYVGPTEVNPLWKDAKFRTKTVIEEIP